MSASDVYDSFDDGDETMHKKSSGFGCDDTEGTDDASETDRVKEATEIKEQIYQEKLAQIKLQVALLKAGNFPEYLRKQKKLEQIHKERQKQLQSYHHYLFSKVEQCFEKEQLAAIQEYESKKIELKESLIADLQDKKKQVESERHTMELTGACMSSMEVKPVKRKLRRRANEPVPSNNEKRRKSSPTQFSFILAEDEILEDLMALNKGKVYKPIHENIADPAAIIPTLQQYECKIDNGKLFYDKRWYQIGQSIVLEKHKDNSRMNGVISAITEREIFVRKTYDHAKIRIFVAQLQKGKCTIKKRNI